AAPPRRSDPEERGEPGRRRTEEDLPAVGRPDRRVVRTVRRGQPRSRTAGEIEEPQVRAPLVGIDSFEDNSPFVRRKLEPAVTPRFPDVALTLARAIEPYQLRFRIRAAIKKHAGLGDREFEPVKKFVPGDSLSERDRLADEFLALDIQALSDERPCTDEQKPVGRRETEIGDRG